MGGVLGWMLVLVLVVGCWMLVGCGESVGEATAWVCPLGRTVVFLIVVGKGVVVGGLYRAGLEGVCGGPKSSRSKMVH